MTHNGAIHISPTVRQFNPPHGIFATTTLTDEELHNLAATHWDDYTPGTGSVGDDVRLINVPAKGFYHSIAAIDDTNRDKVYELTEPRRDGEAPVTHLVIDAPKLPADHAQLIAYRWDVLDQDGSRTSEAEWEIIAILAWEGEVAPPMDIREMERNAANAEGGTYREYTPEEWGASRAFWANHAYRLLAPAGKDS